MNQKANAVSIKPRTIYKQFIQRRKTPEQRFWEKVNKRGRQMPHVPELGFCWEWTAGFDKDGYGDSSWDGKHTSAHRISWRLKFGNIPKGICALHKCDNPPCVNPDHLFLGTSGENNSDRQRKGRGNPPVGERNSQSKLKSEDIPKIRMMILGGIVQNKIANYFDVAPSCITKIKNGKNWRHI